MTLIAIGVDQSITKTGLCMRRFTMNGYSKVIRAATVDTPTYNDMRRSLLTFIGLLTPTVIMCEGAFYGKSATAHAAAVKSAAWVEAVVCQYKLGEMFDVVPAVSWRKVAWPGVKRMKSEDAKLYSILQAIKAGIVDPDDHQGDADGICQYAIKMYTEAQNG